MRRFGAFTVFIPLLTVVIFFAKFCNVFQWGRPGTTPPPPPGAGAPAPAPAGAAQGFDAHESSEDPEVFETGEPVAQQTGIYHSIWQLPSDEALANCDLSAPGATEIVPPTDRVDFQAGITLGLAGEYRYACIVPGHCELGMKFKIQVLI
eukprot:jgi/Mesvir1/7052/Mv09168-RA.1